MCIQSRGRAGDAPWKPACRFQFGSCLQFFKQAQKVCSLHWLGKKPERVVRRFVPKTRVEQEQIKGCGDRWQERIAAGSDMEDGNEIHAIAQA